MCSSKWSGPHSRISSRLKWGCFSSIRSSNKRSSHSRKPESPRSGWTSPTLPRSHSEATSPTSRSVSSSFTAGSNVALPRSSGFPASTSPSRSSQAFYRTMHVNSLFPSTRFHSNSRYLYQLSYIFSRSSTNNLLKT